MAQHEDMSSNLRTHVNMAMCVSVRCGDKRIEVAYWFPQQFQFTERSCLKGIRPRVTEQDTGHSSPDLQCTDVCI